MGNLPAIWDKSSNDVNGPEVLKMLNLTRAEAADAAGIPKRSVKSGSPFPPELQQRARQWATMLELVAGFFQGDVGKTVLWFKTENPLLGGFTPREMIQFGRAKKLREIIEDALSRNLP